MKWQIRGANGWRDNEWYSNRKAAVEGIQLMRAELPRWTTYKLFVRLSRAERLKRKLLVRSKYYDEEAKYDGLTTSEKVWYQAYARALRDVAGQL